MAAARLEDLQYKQSLKQPLPKDALAICAEHGLVDLADILLDEGCDIEEPGILGTPLRTASGKGHLSFCELLISRGADVDRDTGYGTALHAAAMCSQHQIVKVLLEAGANPNKVGGRYGLPIQAAAVRGDLESLSDLLYDGADPYARGFVVDVTHAAAMGGHVKLMKYLHQKDIGVRIENPSQRPRRPLASTNHEKESIFKRVTGPKAKLRSVLPYSMRAVHDPLDPTPQQSRHPYSGDCYILEAAAAQGHVDVLAYLLSPYDRISRSDMPKLVYGHGLRTMLDVFRAAISGAQDAMLEFLVAKCDVEPHMYKDLLSEALRQDKASAVAILSDQVTLTVEEYRQHLTRRISFATFRSLQQSMHKVLDGTTVARLCIGHLSAAARIGERSTIHTILACEVPLDALTSAFGAACASGRVEIASLLLAALGPGMVDLDILLTLNAIALHDNRQEILKFLAPLLAPRITQNDFDDFLISAASDGQDEGVHFLTSDSHYTSLVTCSALGLALDYALIERNFLACSVLLSLNVGTGAHAGWITRDGRDDDYGRPQLPRYESVSENRCADYTRSHPWYSLDFMDEDPLKPTPGFRMSLTEEMRLKSLSTVVLDPQGRVQLAQASEVDIERLGPLNTSYKLTYACALGYYHLLPAILEHIATAADYEIVLQALEEVLKIEKGCHPPAQILIDKLLSRSGDPIDFEEMISRVLEHMWSKPGSYPHVGPLSQTRSYSAALTLGPPAVARYLLQHLTEIKGTHPGFVPVLHMAAADGDIEFAKLLISRDVNIGISQEHFGTALQAAAVWGHLHIVDLLLQHGADPNVRGGKYHTALRAAVAAGHHNIVKRLIEAGADVDFTEITDSRPGDTDSTLHLALRQADPAMALQLISMSPSIVQSPSNSIIELACAMDDEPLMLAVIAAGGLDPVPAEQQKVDGTKLTTAQTFWQQAASYAAYNMHFVALQVLLARADPLFDQEAEFNILRKLCLPYRKNRSKAYSRLLGVVVKSLADHGLLAAALEETLSYGVPDYADMMTIMAQATCTAELLGASCKDGDTKLIGVYLDALNSDSQIEAIKLGLCYAIDGGHPAAVKMLCILARPDKLPYYELQSSVKKAFATCARSVGKHLYFMGRYAQSIPEPSHTYLNSSSAFKMAGPRSLLERYDQVFEALIDHDIVPSQADGVRIVDVLHLAAFFGMLSTFRKLFSLYPYLDEPSDEFRSCKEAAFKGRHEAMVAHVIKLLQQKSAAIEQADYLHEACRGKSWDLVTLLVKQGFDPNSTDEDGNTPLRICLQQVQQHKWPIRKDVKEYATIVSLLDRTTAITQADLHYAMRLPGDAEEKASIVCSILERNPELLVSPADFGCARGFRYLHKPDKQVREYIVDNKRLECVTEELVAAIQDRAVIEKLVQCWPSYRPTAGFIRVILQQWVADVRPRECVAVLLNHDPSLIPDYDLVGLCLEAGHRLYYTDMTYKRHYDALDVMLRRVPELVVDEALLLKVQTARDLDCLYRNVKIDTSATTTIVDHIIQRRNYRTSSDELEQMLSVPGMGMSRGAAQAHLEGPKSYWRLLDTLIAHCPGIDITPKIFVSLFLDMRTYFQRSDHLGFLDCLKRHNISLVMTTQIKHALNDTWQRSDDQGLRQLYLDYLFVDAALELESTCGERCIGKDCSEPFDPTRKAS